MEKKTYVRPEAETTEMAALTVIATSDPNVNDEMGDRNQLGKQRGQQYDADEEEYLIEEYLKDNN